MSAPDPVLHWLLRGGLALLFVAAALHKLRDLRGFAARVRGYRLLPHALAAPAAAALAAAELAAAGGLLAPGTGGGGAGLAMALLALYSAAIGANLARGRRHIDCGCLGPARSQSLSAWLLLRNAALGAGAALLLAPPAPRALGWVDAPALAGGALLAALLWSAAHELASARMAMENTP